jgi:hypothetical protein
MSMTSMGDLNNAWGICGFTSSFYTLYAMDPTRAKLNNANNAYRVLAEIKTYLALLKAEASPLMNDIVELTRGFGGDFKDFTIQDYIDHVGTASGKTETAIKADKTYGIAMPPDAVVDYLKRMWGVTTSVTYLHGTDSGGDGIIGVRRETFDTTTMWPKPFGGLRHYLYRQGATIHSWGRTFTSIANADPGGTAPYAPYCLIKV